MATDRGLECGYWLTEHTVSCGVSGPECEEAFSFTLASLARARREARAAGWHKTAAYGWVCEPCYEQMKAKG